MGVQRPHQRAPLTLGTQSRVDLEERLRRQPHHLAGHPVGAGVGFLTDEDHVDIADVIQFSRTAFAHRDHRQPGRLSVTADGGRRHLKRGVQGGVGKGGKTFPDRGER